MGATTTWADGERYQRYMGRWSALVAAGLLTWLEPPSDLDWLDVGCGTGVLAGAVVGTVASGRVVGADPSAGLLTTARARPGVEVVRATAGRLPFTTAGFDRVVSGLVLNFVPDPAAAVAEMVRVLRPDGEMGLYVWDYAEGMQMIRLFWDAATALDPGVVTLDQGELFPVCRPAALRSLLETAGLVQVRTRDLEVPLVFTGVDDYWVPFLGGTGPAPAYVAGLPEAARARLRDEVVDRLPVRADGTVHLTARAFAVRGSRPSS